MRSARERFAAAFAIALCLAGALRADPFAGSLAATEGYDSNILKYSSSDLDLLRSGSRPDKFVVRTADDFRTALDLKLYWTPALFERNQTRVVLEGGADFFAKNPVANYQTLELRLRQEFGRRNYVRAGFSYLPHLYLRNLWDGDARAYQPAVLSRRTLALELGRDFSSRLAAILGYRGEWTRYNPEFAERTGRADLLSGVVSMRFGRRA